VDFLAAFNRKGGQSWRKLKVRSGRKGGSLRRGRSRDRQISTTKSGNIYGLGKKLKIKGSKRKEKLPYKPLPAAGGKGAGQEVFTGPSLRGEKPGKKRKQQLEVSLAKKKTGKKSARTRRGARFAILSKRGEE